MKHRKRFVLYGAAAAAGLAGAASLAIGSRTPGCPAYTPMADLVLIAHAGGGLPDRSYSNSLQALDLAYAHGLRLFEIDLRDVPGRGIVLAHDRRDGLRANAVSGEAALDWLRHHPEARFVTDFKTDNLAGLARLAAIAGDLKARIVPQIYQPQEYGAVRRLGFPPPIFTLYRNRDPDWLRFVNEAELTAVTIPEARVALAPEIRPPVFVHTVNHPVKPEGVSGLYTDCLIPAD